MDNYKEFKEYLEEIFSKEDLPVDEIKIRQFYKYYLLLVDWNQRMNLTGITEMKEVVVKHFLDSVILTKYFRFKNGDKIGDVGTGAGFPGIPLAIMLPKCEFFLADALEKRIRFLNEVIKELELTNCTTAHGRAETIGRDPKYREQFNAVTTRAVASLPVLLEYSSPLLKMGGSFFAYKGPAFEEELAASGKAQRELNLVAKDQVTFEISECDLGFRSILSFQKTGTLKSKYPRREGIPGKKPIL